MTTYYIRERPHGRIVNAVETTSQERADEVAAQMIGDLYADAGPPRHVLEQYRYWNERP